MFVLFVQQSLILRTNLAQRTKEGGWEGEEEGEREGGREGGREEGKERERERERETSPPPSSQGASLA